MIRGLAFLSFGRDAEGREGTNNIQIIDMEPSPLICGIQKTGEALIFHASIIRLYTTLYS